MKYEHATAVTVTIVTHIVTDTTVRPSKAVVLARAAEIVRKWTDADVESHMEDSGLEYIEALEVEG